MNDLRLPEERDVPNPDAMFAAITGSAPIVAAAAAGAAAGAHSGGPAATHALHAKWIAGLALAAGVAVVAGVVLLSQANKPLADPPVTPTIAAPTATPTPPVSTAPATSASPAPSSSTPPVSPTPSPSTAQPSPGQLPSPGNPSVPSNGPSAPGRTPPQPTSTVSVPWPTATMQPQPSAPTTSRPSEGPSRTPVGNPQPGGPSTVTTTAPPTTAPPTTAPSTTAPPTTAPPTTAPSTVPPSTPSPSIRTPTTPEPTASRPPAEPEPDYRFNQYGTAPLQYVTVTRVDQPLTGLPLPDRFSISFIEVCVTGVPEAFEKRQALPIDPSAFTLKLLPDGPTLTVGGDIGLPGYPDGLVWVPVGSCVSGWMVFDIASAPDGVTGLELYYRDPWSEQTVVWHFGR